MISDGILFVVGSSGGSAAGIVGSFHGGGVTSAALVFRFICTVRVLLACCRTFATMGMTGEGSHCVNKSDVAFSGDGCVIC